MAVESKRLWKANLSRDLSAALEWQDSGSLLLAQTPADALLLERRAADLQDAGHNAELLEAAQIREMEPALAVSDAMHGLLLTSDAQLNGRLASEVLLKQCLDFGDAFSFSQREGVSALLLGASGSANGVLTDHNRRIEARRAVVVAAGAWSGTLLAEALEKPQWKDVSQPRKGHLLEIEKPVGMPAISHGLMESCYTSHYSNAAVPSSGVEDIIFTATTSASGSILLGSSREFAGFDKSYSDSVECAILQRAGQFLPGLAGVLPAASKTRVGLRPFSASGPFVGGVPGTPKLFVACGHEGSGLTLAPATAEIIARGVLGETVPEFATQMLRAL